VTDTAVTRQPATAVLQHAFLAVLPRVRTHARIAFRDLPCPHARDEAIAEAVALSWKWFVRLVRRGKHPEQFVSALATFAARAVRSGRRLCGQEKPKDVLSPIAQSRRGFTVSPLPPMSTLHGSPFDEALHDNTQTPVPEQVSFRVDFPAWLDTRSDRDRVIIGDLMAGERTMDVSAKYQVSQGRVSQLRREYLASWRAFCAGVEMV
jgi:hypothetical protein